MNWQLVSADMPSWAFVLIVLTGLFVELWSDNGPRPMHPLECAALCEPAPVQQFSAGHCVCGVAP